MAQQIEQPRIRSRESPRQIIRVDFKLDLPIRGGWGYTAEDAVIIDRNDPIVPAAVPFNGVSVEYAFAEKRIYEELIIFRPKSDRYAGIRWNMLRQQLSFINNRPHDCLTFEVNAFREADWAALKSEWEGPNGFASEAFDEAAHGAKREGLMCKYVAEFWFEISSFYGSQE